MSLASSGEVGVHIENLLDDVESAAGPVAWPRVEALVTALVEMYGAGLERVVAMARASARDPTILDESLAGDDLVASLLALHDLHPAALEKRVKDALDGHAPPRETAFVPVDRLVRGTHP